MKWLKHLLISCLMTVLVCSCFPFSTAHADIIFPPSSTNKIELINQDTIHYLTTEGCYRFTEEHLFVPCDKNCAADTIFEEETKINEYLALPGTLKYNPRSFQSFDGKTYVYKYFEENEIYYWDVDAATPWVHFATLDKEIFDQYPGNQYMNEYAVGGNTIYVLFTHMNAGQCDLYAFDRTTGKGKRIYADKSLNELFPYPDENKVAVSQWKAPDNTNILLIDKNTLEVEKFLPNEAGEAWTRFIMNADGTGYATDYHHLYQIKDGKATELRTITEDYGGADNLFFCPFHQDEVMYPAYLGDESLLFILPTHAGGDEVRPLTLVGNTNKLHQANPTTPSMTDFIISHGNLTIEYADYPSTFDEVAQAMMTQSDKFDIMLLSFSDGDLKKLYQRGYACNLSDVPELDDYFANLYPMWRDACSVDDNMFAMPLVADGSHQLLRNTALWDELALGDVPTTYDQLFDCIQRWDEQGALEEAPLFGTGINSYETLFWKLMLDYIAANDRQGNDLSFQHETFQHLMERLTDLRPILEAHDALALTGDMMIYPEGGITFIKSERSIPILPVDTLEPMPVALSDSLGCTERVDLYVLMINPYSTQRRLAEEFLIYLANHLTVTSQCLFINNGITGYESEVQNTVDNSSAYSPEAIANYEAYLAQAIKENNSDLIQFWRDAINEAEEEQSKEQEPIWNISPEEVAKYQTALPHLAILQRTNFQLLYENGLSTMQQYLDSRMTLDQMCRHLDEIVRMNAMED